MLWVIPGAGTLFLSGLFSGGLLFQGFRTEACLLPIIGGALVGLVIAIRNRARMRRNRARMRAELRDLRGPLTQVATNPDLDCSLGFATLE